jgi:hypothetical protein
VRKGRREKAGIRVRVQAIIFAKKNSSPALPYPIGSKPPSA